MLKTIIIMVVIKNIYFVNLGKKADEII